MSYYTAKVAISFESDNGKIKTKNELYLVDAESVTEVEAKMYKDFESYKGDWEVTGVNETKIVKIVT